MALKLVNFCLAWILLLGFGWGGVLAAAVCPHAGCETATGVSDQISEQTAAQGEHQSVECHSSASAEDHSAQTQAQQEHAGEPPVEKQSTLESPDSHRFVSGSHASSCSHCMSRPDAPPSSKLEPQSNPVRKSGKDATPHVAPQTLAHIRTHVRQIIPSRRAPPGEPDRHLLLGIFRI